MIGRQTYRIKPGSIGNLQISTEDLSGPGPGEVQITIKSIGLNFADLYAIWGLYSATPEGEFIPGLEISGIISVAGPGSKYQVGDRVMGVTRFGAYTDIINLDERYLQPIPDDWTFEEGAAYLVQVLTAYYALFELGNLQKGDIVLVHSGAGGVGLFANRLAKKIGATTIGTTGSQAKLAKMQEEGYDHMIVRSKQFSKDLKQILAGRPLDLILECIGGDILRQGFNQLASEGRMIVYGSAHFTSPGDRPNYFKMIWKYLRRPKIDPMQLPSNNRSVMGFNLIYLYERVDLMHIMLEHISSMQLEKPVVGAVLTFDKLPEAVRLLQSGRTMGKVVVNV